MCRVLAIGGIPRNKIQDAWRFVQAARPFMLEGGNTDAYGYAAWNGRELYGERWLDVKQAFKLRDSYDTEDQALIKALGDSVETEQRYNSFGDVSIAGTQAIIAHSRLATCGKGIENAHPFVRDGVALIHNGLIYNSGTLLNLTSTCDSETILNEYVDCRVDANAEEIQAVADSLSGSYACAVLAPKPDGQGYLLDIFRNVGSDLCVARVKDLGVNVFATKPEILLGAAKKCKMRIGKVLRIHSGHLIRIDARTGDRIGSVRFKPGYSAGSVYRGVQDTDWLSRQREYAAKGSVSVPALPAPSVDTGTKQLDVTSLRDALGSADQTLGEHIAREIRTSKSEERLDRIREIAHWRREHKS